MEKPLIVSNPNVMMGKPVVAGTRITVELILGKLAAGGQIIERLRQDGHRVWYVAEMGPGISDDIVLASANREAALLLTADKDFGVIVK